jgi:hypothetical protein
MAVMNTPVRLIDSPPDMSDALIEAIRSGIPLLVAWRKAGLSNSTYKDWAHVAATDQWRNGTGCPAHHLAIIQDFCERVEQARADWEAEMVGNIMTAARERNAKTGLLD